MEPFDAEEIGSLITAALSRRNGVRFVLALALGTRQGETIGLKWNRLDKNAKALRITKQLQRANVAARLQRPAQVRGEIPQAEAVSGDLQAPQAEAVPAAVPRYVRQPRAVVP